MPLTIELLPGPYTVSDIWISEEDFLSLLRKQIVGLFEEDIFALLEDLGGLDTIIGKLYWEPINNNWKRQVREDSTSLARPGDEW